MIRKLLIIPWFGPLPIWMPHWRSNITRLSEHGYMFLMGDDPVGFRKRCREKLGVDAPIVPGGSKIHDYRAAFGVLFEEEIRDTGVEFWGHTDLDCVYGRVEQWVTDDFLDGLDLHSNHGTYVCGPWSLYRTGATEEIFRTVPGWRDILEEPATTGWVEQEFSRACERELGIDHRLRYTYWQTRELNRFDACRWDGDRLMEDDQEVMMAHFRRTKVYPEQLVL